MMRVALLVAEQVARAGSREIADGPAYVLSIPSVRLPARRYVGLDPFTCTAREAEKFG